MKPIMKTEYFLVQLAIFVLAFSCVQCWNQDELDMYDLIEELGMKPNFYEILGLSEVSRYLFFKGLFLLKG